MKNNTSIKGLYIISVTNIIFSIYLISTMSTNFVPLQFNLYGTPTSWGNKWLLMLFPILILGIAVSLHFYRRKVIDNPNVKLENKFFYAMTLFFIGLQTSIYFQTISNNHTTGKIVIYYITFALGLLFCCIGYLSKHIKPNKFFGIRTKYALQDKSVWYKTHSLASKTNLISGFFIIITGIVSFKLDNLSIAFIGTVLGVIFSIIPALYSKVIFRKK